MCGLLRACRDLLLERRQGDVGDVEVLRDDKRKRKKVSKEAPRRSKRDLATRKETYE
jgi:hypothetical protein